MKTVVFFDASTPFPYSNTSLTNQCLGGIIASTIRIAEKMGETCLVFVLQKHRKTISKGNANTIYAPIDLDIDNRQVSSVITLRNSGTIPYLSQKFTKAKYFLWCHDHPYYSHHLLISDFHLIQKEKFTLIAVSQSHLDTIKKILQEYNLNTKNITFDYIYNPIDNDLHPNNTKVDSNKLFFCSSPIKGEHYVYYLFEFLRAINPNFQLFIANPNYKRENSQPTKKNAIHLLGALPHSEVIKHMRESLCLFYPNYVYPETFGLAMAEANAVGTPVLTHNLGSTSEVLGDNRQIIDVTKKKECIDRIMEWHCGNRPIVTGNPLFRLDKIAKEWNNRLD